MYMMKNNYTSEELELNPTGGAMNQSILGDLR